MLPITSHWTGHSLYALCVTLVLFLTTGASTARATSSPYPALPQEATPQTDPAQAAANTPRDCIDPLMASHIAATLVSLLPLPGWADAADAAAYALNIALKDCPPDLTAPPDIVVEQPNHGCFVDLSLPTPREMANLIAMDRAIIEEILADPTLDLTPFQRAELTTELNNEFGRFANYAYGSYTNIYGISLPIAVTSLDTPYWGAVGKPEVFHYNSDVLIALNYPGRRISPSTLEVPVGNHLLTWEGNTIISEFDYVPFFVASSAYRAYKAAQAQATKRFAIDGTKAALKKTIEQMLREGNRFFAKQVAKEIAQQVIVEASLVAAEQIYEASPYYSGGSFTGARTIAQQKLTIVDANPPAISGVQNLVLEATDPGGMQSARKLAELQAQVAVSDDCDQNPTLTYTTPRFWPLLVDSSGEPLPSAEIIWRASDDGAATAQGGVNTTEVVQQITVVDTEPPFILAPPPVMMYAQPGGAEAPLGNPQVFDVVDLRPTIAYDAPGTTPGVKWPIFDAGIHYVQWRATDQSNNTSHPALQLVNIKQPGTNHTPTAIAQTGNNTVQAIADVPIKITLRGNDQDVDTSGLRDPLWFRIDHPPDNGFFIAPLYPYFVDDYRITARYSPQIATTEGETFALSLAQDPQAMEDYMKELCEEDLFRTDLPKDFVYFMGGDQKYLAVDDDSYTYIYDQAYRRCTPGGSTIAPTTSPRISVWDANGLYVGEQEHEGSGGYPLRDINFDLTRGYILSVQSDSSSTGTSVVGLSSIHVDNPSEPIVGIESYSLHNSVNSIVVNANGDTRTPEYKNAGAAAWDDDHGVLYVIGDPHQNLRGMAAFKPAPCDSDPDGDPDACLDFVGSQIYSLSIRQSTMLGDFPGIDIDAMRLEQLRDIALDSHGNVYVLARSKITSGFDRIYKFAPATKNPDGSVTLGELIGWLGKCDAGPNCNYIEHRSIGYSCTDETCTIEGSEDGDLPGQLDGAAAIAIDRNDVLYVADSGNQRVQRFSPDGLFAGEARSQASCDNCSGFVLGAFGSPGNIAVNSSHFYILDIEEELVHIFEASVVHSVDDESAWVEYQSKNNYIGADAFTFRATDGFHTEAGDLLESAPATVAIQVARNFRPPIGVDGYATTAEETPVAIVLEGYDLDGELDTLSYAVSSDPQHGTLSGNPPDLAYQPAEDFAGVDEFHFTVSDGMFTSEPAMILLEVTPHNDTPEVAPQSATLKAGLGHAVTLYAAVFDPDEGDELVASVDWGDGTKETSGDLDATGGMNGPSLTPLIEGRAELLAYHTYQTAGSYTIKIEVTDSQGAKGSAQVQITVEVMADLVLGRVAKALVPHTDQHYHYELTVTNQPSPQGHGIAAGDIRISEVLTGSATYGAAIASSGSCQVSAKTLTCHLGALQPNQETTVTVQLATGSATSGAVIALDGRVSAGTADPILENNRDRFDVAVVPVGDFYVDSYRDGADAIPGNGVCATEQGECTARAAIMEANAVADAQTIVFGSGVYVLESEAESAAGTALDPASGDLDIDGAVTLLGIGAQKSILHGNAVDRVLEIHSGEVRIEQLAITGGDAGPQGEGGGIYHHGGDLYLLRTVVDGNRAVNGGGILNAGGVTHIVESSLADNSAQSSGGGLLNKAQLMLENVTISGNQANTGGGLLAVGGNAQLLYVTLAGNSATNAGGGINSTGSAVRIENSLLAGNDAPIGADCALNIVSGGHNLIGSLRDCSLSGTTSGNVVGQAPGIDVLTGNGAGTYAHPLLAGSPAIGRATCLLATDQTGAQRPEATGCDIGSFEAGAVATGVFMPVIGKR